MWEKPNPNDVSAFVNDPDALSNSTRVMQIIVGSLTMGVIWFIAIVLFLGLGGNEEPPKAGRPEILGLPVLTLLSAVMGAAALVASFLVPRLVVDAGLHGAAKAGSSSAATTGDAGSKQLKPAVAAYELLPLFQTQLIIGAALAEGGAFFATIAYMLEHHRLALGTAGALLAVLVSRFPTVDRVNAWLDESLSRLNEMRNAGW